MSGPGTHVVVEADGGSRGNPGPAGFGAVVRDAASGEVLAERRGAIGEQTNNVAEYRGLIAGLEAALAVGADRVDVRMDSKLVVEQMTGRWRVKEPRLQALALEAGRLAARLGEVRYSWIPRARNAHADRLANEAMDEAARDGRADRGVGGGAATVAPATPPATGASAPTHRLSGWMDPAAPPTVTLLVRHGATRMSVERRFSGRGDVELSPDGLAQAAAVAERLAGWGSIDAVVASPLRRAQQTAVAIADRLGLVPTTVGDLAETDFGDWEGLTFREVRERWPSELDAWLASDTVAPPGGESFAEAFRRVRRARDAVLTAHPGRTVVVVSHVTPVKSLVRLALHAPHESVFRMHVDLVSITEIDWHADGPAVLRRFNDTAHHTPTYGH